MDQLDLARIQFATTSIYHFFFVPVTMGLAILVAVLHTRWHRSGNPELRRLTRFFGTLMLISISVGVVTGLVQEFQFGMDWSAYSRFVGDVFGAPLAMEGLAAFFLESTFLGLWLFGWNVLPKRVHLFTAWMVPVGAFLSALFIIAANSWMQNPRGYTINPDTGRAELTSIGDVFTNPIFLWGYVHVLLVALIFGGAVLLAVSAWHLRRGNDVRAVPRHREAGPVRADGRDGAAVPDRRPARHQRDDLPADEDRRRRGQLGHLPAVFVLGDPDRRLQPGRDPDQDHRDPAPAVDPGHRYLGRRGAGPVRGERRSTTSSTGRATTCRTCSSSTGRCG